MATRSVIRIDPQRLSDALAQRGWSKAMLAEKSGRAASTISAIFSGEPVAASTLEKVARALSDAPIIPGAAELLAPTPVHRNESAAVTTHATAASPEEGGASRIPR